MRRRAPRAPRPSLPAREVGRQGNGEVHAECHCVRTRSKLCIAKLQVRHYHLLRHFRALEFDARDEVDKGDDVPLLLLPRGSNRERRRHNAAAVLDIRLTLGQKEDYEKVSGGRLWAGGAARRGAARRLTIPDMKTVPTGHVNAGFQVPGLPASCTSQAMVDCCALRR